MENTSEVMNMNAQVDASALTNANIQADACVTSQLTAISVLDELQNACVNRKYQSFKDLAAGEYIVNFFSIVDTKHGTRIRVDMGEIYMLLPERFTKILTAEKIPLLNQTSKIMVYGGKDSSNRDRLILDFREATSYIAEMIDAVTDLNDENILM